MIQTGGIPKDGTAGEGRAGQPSRATYNVWFNKCLAQLDFPPEGEVQLRQALVGWESTDLLGWEIRSWASTATTPSPG